MATRPRINGVPLTFGASAAPPSASASATASTSLHKSPPFERILDQRLQSVSSFVSTGAEGQHQHQHQHEHLHAPATAPAAAPSSSFSRASPPATRGGRPSTSITGAGSRGSRGRGKGRSGAGDGVGDSSNSQLHEQENGPGKGAGAGAAKAVSQSEVQSQTQTQIPSQPQWREEMPQAILFPSNKPTSRADAAVLDRWITSAFLNYAQRSQEQQGQSTGAGTGTGPGVTGLWQEEGLASGLGQGLGLGQAQEEDLSRTVEELVPILSIGLHEIVRQVTQHCLERGAVLEKIWRTYVELFERALSETRASLRRTKEKTLRAEAELTRAQAELEELREKQPEQVAKLEKMLEAKFRQRREELLAQLKTTSEENETLREHLAEQKATVAVLFPQFERYKDSVYRQVLEQRPGVLPPSAVNVEARLAADFRRVLQTMPPEARRRVGFFVASLLGLRTRTPGDTLEALTERRNQNSWKIQQLEDRLNQLRGLE